MLRLKRWLTFLWRQSVPVLGPGVGPQSVLGPGAGQRPGMGRLPVPGMGAVLRLVLAAVVGRTVGRTVLGQILVPLVRTEWTVLGRISASLARTGWTGSFGRRWCTVGRLGLVFGNIWFSWWFVVFCMACIRMGGMIVVCIRMVGRRHRILWLRMSLLLIIT